MSLGIYGNSLIIGIQRHTGLSARMPFDILFLSIIYTDFFRRVGHRVVCYYLAGSEQFFLGRRFLAALQYAVSAVDVLAVQPYISAAGNLECQIIVLSIIFAYQQGKSADTV